MSRYNWLPGADHPSPRVYKLLKTDTLETLRYDVLAQVGSPLTAEELNDEELRRLFLVMMAKMCVEGNWNGLVPSIP